MRRQDDFANCPCDHDRGFCPRALPQYPKLQVVAEYACKDSSTQQTSQTKSAYFTTCYPRRRRLEEKRSSEEFLAVVNLSRPATNLLPPRSPCTVSCRNQNNQRPSSTPPVFHLESVKIVSVDEATQTEKFWPSSCWSRLLMKITPSKNKRRKPFGELEVFRVRHDDRNASSDRSRREKERQTMVSFTEVPQWPSETNVEDSKRFDSSEEFWNYVPGESPSMLTHFRPSVPNDDAKAKQRSGCCCTCEEEEEEECCCRCCCRPELVFVDANLQTSRSHQMEEKNVQTEAREKRQCCNCCRFCCTDNGAVALQQKNLITKNVKPEDVKATTIRPIKNELVDLRQPKVNRFELLETRNVSLGRRGVSILQEFLLSTMSLDAANNLLSNEKTQKQLMKL